MTMLSKAAQSNRGFHLMASGTDIKAATETYNGFIKAATWGTGVVIVIVAIVVGVIAS
jgi:hypothetical protein